MTSRRTLVSMLALLTVLAAACTTASSDPDPDLSDEAKIQLQTRAFVRACECTGSGVYSPVVDADLESALVGHFGDMIAFLTEDEIAERFSPDATVAAGGKLIRVEDVVDTEDPNVVGVNVWTVTNTSFGETFLFRWDGTHWADATAASTGVTVTTSVS